MRPISFTLIFLGLFCMSMQGQTSSTAAINFVVLGDPQPEEPPLEQPWVFKTMLKEIAALNPTCTMIVGDCIRGFTDDSIQMLRQWKGFDAAVSGIRSPLMLVPGNHDVWNDASQSEFKRRFGRLYGSQDYGPIHFIMLDSYEVGNFDRIGPEQMEWLARDLEQHKSAQHIFVGVHAPLWAYGNYSNWMKDVHPLLDRYPVRAVFGGHWHIYQRSGIIDGIRYYVTGGAGGMQALHDESGGEFFHYMYITIRDSTVSYAVIQPGSVHPDSFVTKESSAHSGILRDDVTGDPRIFLTGENLTDARITTTLHNPFERSLHLTYSWRLNQAAFAVNPFEGECTLAPGRTQQLTFRLLPTLGMTLEKVLGAKPEIVFTISDSDSLPATTLSKELIAVRSSPILALKKTPIIDGDLKEWGTTWPVKLHSRLQISLLPERWAGPGETSGQFALALKDSTLYFAGTVHDKQMYHSSRKQEPYQADAVSLYLDLRDSSTFQKRMFVKDVVLLVFAPPSDAGEEPYWQTVYPYGSPLKGVRYASKKIPGGYTVEAAIPLSELKNFAPARSSVGLDVCIDNLDSAGNRTRMLWNGIWANFMYANRYGRLMLH